jgi:CheY-like chemotaxis protein
MYVGLITWGLKSEGHERLTAANGAEAVALYRSLASGIDLVITDLNMPVVDGVQEILRIRVTRKDAQIICMLAYPEDRPPEQILTLPVCSASPRSPNSIGPTWFQGMTQSFRPRLC